MIGKTLAHYEITASLGHGGMGEVYRARDTKLDREVALKLLPQEMSRDPERIARFQREARTLASLQHPHIASIYGFEEVNGVRFLVMELVEGDDLSVRLAGHGAFSVHESLEIAAQIATGLETAHEQGIVHRDLKPANVKLRTDGTVKILDFGLARAYADPDDSSDPSLSPTITAAMTQAGTILGTASYMSPEQARGKAVDRRTDLWAFGCLLFELLTGRTAFGGETVTDVLSAIVHLEPDWTLLPSNLHPSVEKLLRRCLQRDPRKRLRDAGDAWCDLQEILDSGPKATAPLSSSPAPAARRFWLTYTLTAAAAGVLGAVLWSLLSGPVSSTPVSDTPVTRTSIVLPDGQRQPRLMQRPLAISPDGTMLAYCARDAEGTIRLYLRSLDSYETREVPASEDADIPFFSPDGQWVGFIATGYLRKAAVSGGAPLQLARVGGCMGASWGPDNKIIYAPTINAGLWRIDASGGTPEQLTKPDFVNTGYANVWPQHLPGGDQVLFSVWGRMSDGITAPHVLDLTTGERHRAREGFTAGDRYFASGHLGFADITGSGNFFAQPFDLATSSATGNAVPALSDVRYFDSQSATPYLDTSEDGTAVYVSSQIGEGILMWVDRSGNETPIIHSEKMVAALQLSPDERSALFHDEQGGLWLVDLERGAIEALIRADVLFITSAVWSPDGKKIAVSSNDAGSWDLYEFDVASRGKPEPLLLAPFDQHMSSWVGDKIVYSEDRPETGLDIWLLPLAGEPTPVEQSPANEYMAALSPNEQLLAFVSDESGRNQVYVRDLVTGERRSVSIDGGRAPLWSKDGRELYFRKGYSVMAAEVQTNGSLSVAAPRELFQRPLDSNTFLGISNFYDVTRDSSRFLAVTDRATTEIKIITNWFSELK